MINFNLLECHTKRSTIETQVDIGIDPTYEFIYPMDNDISAMLTRYMVSGGGIQGTNQVDRILIHNFAIYMLIK